MEVLQYRFEQEALSFSRRKRETPKRLGVAWHGAAVSRAPISHRPLTQSPQTNIELLTRKYNNYSGRHYFASDHFVTQGGCCKHGGERKLLFDPILHQKSYGQETKSVQKERLKTAILT